MRLQITILTSVHFQELKQLSDELRSDVIYHVSKTGGHLGSSLRVAELTVALHYVFNAFLRTRYSGMLATSHIHTRFLTGWRDKKPTKMRHTNGMARCTRRFWYWSQFHQYLSSSWNAVGRDLTGIAVTGWSHDSRPSLRSNEQCRVSGF